MRVVALPPYSRLIVDIYRTRSAIIIQRWWRNQLVKKIFRKIIYGNYHFDFVHR
jgi:hypothetical protein